MRCENYFCAYYSEHECRLSIITLDIRGCCEDCILIDADDNIETQRERLFRHLDELFDHD